MKSELIFQPMLVMMLLTAVVWVWMYARRIPAMKRAGLDAQTYTSPDKVIGVLPDQVNYSSHNLKNLFELPVLFYGLCFYLFLTNSVDYADLVSAWVFVAFRTLHSLNHCTANIVIVRFWFYFIAAVALWFMLGRALLNVF